LVGGVTRRPTPQEEFAAFLARAGADPRVLGVVLSGSRAREGTATARSDYDLTAVLADGVVGAGDEGDSAGLADLFRRDAVMDVSAIGLSDFRSHALPGSGTEWNRYAFTHAKILKDTPDGLVAELASAKGRLAPDEARRAAPEALDGFLNSAYRSLKNHRDGDLTAARLDAAEAVPFHLAYVFALHRRVRPYNKYLGWELRHHPLGAAQFAHDHLPGLLEAALGPAAPAALRRLFGELEPHARAAGHDAVLDGWGEDLLLIRGGARGDTPPA
jgi:hypothetical protein